MDELTWKWAFANNCAIPILESYSNTSLNIEISDSMKSLIRQFAHLTKSEVELRELTGEVPATWKEVCKIGSTKAQDYAPRWTIYCFYFRNKTAPFFRNTRGLDVGARIRNAEQKSFWDLGPPNKHRVDLKETLVSHYEHYAAMGSNMTAIDVNLSDIENQNIVYGDARLLYFESCSFDFITIPMLLGPTNPCSTYLEIAICLSELTRILKQGGFIYIADAGFQPSIGFAAQCLNLSVYYSKGTEDGLPVGTLIRKPKSKEFSSRFDSIFSLPKLQPITFHSRQGEVFKNCNLLFNKEDISSYLIDEILPTKEHLSFSNC
jgi:SAM-dependent methyltransferase